MPFDDASRTAPCAASFGEAAIALMLHRAHGAADADLRAELRALAAARDPAARLLDAYCGGRRRGIGRQ